MLGKHSPELHTPELQLGSLVLSGQGQAEEVLLKQNCTPGQQRSGFV